MSLEGWFCLYDLIILFFFFPCSVIFDRLGDKGRIYQQATMMHLSNYAEDGLRTMVFAYRKIEALEYESWNIMFTKAKATIGPEREELLEETSELIEKDLFLLGAVAVEDKLQKGVSYLPSSLFVLSPQFKIKSVPAGKEYIYIYIYCTNLHSETLNFVIR